MPPHAESIFASDNSTGICPEAFAAITAANVGAALSYGDDAWTKKARQRFKEVFETECEVYFVFNGSAANALSLSALCRSYESVLCHEMAHLHTDECGAPELFSGGSKVVPLAGPAGKLTPAAVEGVVNSGHGVHSQRPGAISITQATELGTLYHPAEIQALAAVARRHGMSVHMDGARFANAAAAWRTHGFSPADITWRAGVDVLCFSGAKNGMLGTEAVVFFNLPLARDFDYRVKQAGQLASKMRFGAAQWDAMLTSDAWLTHAAHANQQARNLADAVRGIRGVSFVAEPEVNGLFLKLSPAMYAGMQTRGWQFHPWSDDGTYRLMCSWATSAADITAFAADLNAFA